MIAELNDSKVMNGFIYRQVYPVGWEHSWRADNDLLDSYWLVDVVSRGYSTGSINAEGELVSSLFDESCRHKTRADAEVAAAKYLLRQQ